MIEAPLRGQRVVITRAVHQASAWCKAFEEAGADVELLPLIAITPPEDSSLLDQAASRLTTYDWLVLTSANSARVFLTKVQPPITPKIAVVGPATAQAVLELGFKVDLEAEKSQAEGLIERLGPRAAGTNILVPQADDARPTLVDGLRIMGAQVKALIAYRKSLPEQSREQLAALLDDPRPFWVTLTSPRIARHFLELMEGREAEYQTLSIGPVTSAALRKLGVEPDIEAPRPTIEAVVASVIARSVRDC